MSARLATGSPPRPPIPEVVAVKAKRTKNPRAALCWCAPRSPGPRLLFFW